jgi:hypothetical protein
VVVVGVLARQRRSCTRRSKTCAVIAVTKKHGRKSIREHAGRRQYAIGPETSGQVYSTISRIFGVKEAFSCRSVTSGTYKNGTDWLSRFGGE